MARASRLYLLSYNTLQTLGWALALCRLFVFCPTPFHGAFSCVGRLICLLQTVSFLEVIHAAVGLVPAGPVLTLMQWGGRTHFLLAILLQIPEVQWLPSVFVTFTAWSISEVIRYSHYALASLKICPALLVYLRYTAFILLYPIGVGPGEMFVMYKALPLVKEKNLHSATFDKLPFDYHSFLWGVLISYPFLWLKLYLHLFKQRRVKLGKRYGPKQL